MSLKTRVRAHGARACNAAETQLVLYLCSTEDCIHVYVLCQSLSGLQQLVLQLDCLYSKAYDVPMRVSVYTRFSAVPGRLCQEEPVLYLYVCFCVSPGHFCLREFVLHPSTCT
jgi:hypothetical protein